MRSGSVPGPIAEQGSVGRIVDVGLDDVGVHARRRGEDCIARVRFSYLDGTVGLISTAPVKNVPLQRVVNRLLSDVQVRLADCLQAICHRSSSISNSESRPQNVNVEVMR